MKKNVQVTLVCLFLSTLYPTQAWSFEPGDYSVFVVGGLGFGGRVTVDLEDQGQSTKGKEDFENTLELGFWADYAFSDLVALGGGVNILWWNGENMDNQGFNKSRLVEFGPSIRIGAEPIPKVTFYFRFAPGFCLLALTDDLEDSLSEVLEANINIKPGFGFNIATFGGVHIEFSERTGLIFEIGHAYHIAYGIMRVDSGEGNYTLEGGQFRINVGLSF